MSPLSAGATPPLIAICSGKGGVGKSTVAVNLALAMRDLGVRVGLVDADLYGPNIPRMLNLTRRAATDYVTLWKNPQDGRRDRITPVERLGIRVMSAQFLIGESQGLVVAAEFASMLLTRLLRSPDWGDADVLLVDLPPGTGDLQQQLTSAPELLGALIVATPQDVAHLDARKLLAMLSLHHIRILGGVENMAGLDCPSCGYGIQLFRPTQAERSIWIDVPKLVSIPFHMSVTGGDHAGVPVVEREPTSPAAAEFGRLAVAIKALLG